MWRMKIQLLLSLYGLWCAVHHGQCSEQRHKHTQNTQPDGDTHTEKRTEHQVSTSAPLFISAVGSSSSSSVSSRVTDIFPVPAAARVCGSSCRSCSSSSACAAAEEPLCDTPLSFPAGQENVSIRQSRKHSKESSGKRSNTSRILKEQSSSTTTDTDPTLPCRDQQIPTFEEWSKIMMEEENEKSQVTQHLSQSLHTAGKKLQQIFTNYASVECGAKILSSNPEAKSTSAILMENMDMYMLNPCNNKIWFTIELCQPIQVRQLDIANFEIFSSNPREFLVSISDRYPTKKWVRLGTFRTRDERTVQSFPLDEHQFARYIKVDLLSHFGSEHFCPLSLIRVFGTSMMEEYELNSEASDRHTHTQEDHDYDQSSEFEHQSSRNLIGSAKDALFTMVNNIAANVIGAHPKTAGRSGNSSSEDLNRTGAVSPEESHRTNRSVDQPGVSTAVSAPPESLSVAPEEQRIVTLLLEAEDEPDTGVHEHTHTLQNEHTHTLQHKHSHTYTLQEYLLQRCSSPEVIRPTETPVTHTHTPSDAQMESVVSFSVTAALELVFVSEHTADTHRSEEDTELSFSSPQRALSGPTAPADAPLDGLKPADTPLDTPLEDSSDVEPPDAPLDHTDPQNSSTAAHSGSQKESVFMRLSNRIRVLEMNMSLSGRYLEQLSQRYRRQVEEMQRAFNTTIIKLQNTTTMAEEQDQRQTDSIQALQAQLENVSVLLLQLSVSVDQLQQEVWDRQVYLLLCVLLCVLLVLLLCVHQRQLRETAAVHTQTHTHTSCSATDRERSSGDGMCVRRRASDPPALSGLLAADMCVRSSGPQHSAVSKKSSKLVVPECVSAAVSPQVSVHQECVCVEDVLSDGSSEGSQADDTLFCGISSCTHLCDALPAAARWTQTTHTSQRRRGGRRTAERLQRTHTHTPPQRRGPLLEP